MSDQRTVQFRCSQGLVPYEQAVAEMEARVAAIHDGLASELIWFLEHPPLYTAGTSAQAADLLTPDRFPVFKAGRGGQYTYHGPGQRVAYVLLNLRHYGQDVRAYVQSLEAWIIAALEEFDIIGETRCDRIGIWVQRQNSQDSPIFSPGEDKIGAIGVRVRRWITFHGAALNVAPDLSHFEGIVPCGVTQHGVTSMAALGKNITMDEVDETLKRAFEDEFKVVLKEE